MLREGFVSQHASNSTTVEKPAGRCPVEIEASATQKLDAEVAQLSLEGRHDEAPESSQLEQVLPFLLQCGHPTAEARLACFHTSKSMADLVLMHAPCTHLTLSAPAAAAKAACDDSKTIGTHAWAQATAAQQLAAQSNNVTLSLHDGLLTPADCMLQCITTIQLHGMQLDELTSGRLQLHRLPRLHTLSLQKCRMGPNSSSTPAASQQHRSTSVRTLECIGGCGAILPFVATNMVDPSQLQTLVTDTSPASVTSLLPQLSALRELTMLPAPGHQVQQVLAYPVPAAAPVTDDDFQRLLAHPLLARVSLPEISGLQRSYADSPCTWDSLNLLAGAALAHLALMPLAGIQSVIVHRYMGINRHWWANAQGVRLTAADVIAVIRSISQAQNLVLQGVRKEAKLPQQPAANSRFNSQTTNVSKDHAKSDNTACQWADPSFTLLLYSAEHFHCARLLTFMMRHLAPNSTLVLAIAGGVNPDVLASLAAAPPTLTTLHFASPIFRCAYYTETSGGDEQIEGIRVGEGLGVMAHVRAHVNHVVLDVVYNYTPQDLLRYYVAGVKRPLRVTLRRYRETCDQWSASDQTMVNEWVAEHASQLSVDFQ